MEFRNREGKTAFNCAVTSADRSPGVSAMMRVKNEAEFIEASVRSVLPYVDEVVLVLQPCDDDTPLIIESIRSPKLKVFPYPFEIGKNGPGFSKRNDSSSVHSIVYYYNYALSLTTRQWVLKWDGDMIALPTLQGFVENRQEAEMRGREVVKIERPHLWLSRQKPGLIQDPGLFLVDESARFVAGAACEVFSRCKPPRGGAIHFLHFKWCKAHFDDVWPANWRDNPHFRRIHARRQPGVRCPGRVPPIFWKCFQDG